MKLLNILINNRVDHVVNFDAGKNDAPNTYLAEITNRNRINLISFYGDSFENIPYQTDSGQELIKLCKIDVKEEEPKEAGDGGNTQREYTIINRTVSLTFSPNEARSSHTGNAENVKIEGDKDLKKYLIKSSRKIVCPISANEIYHVTLKLLLKEKDDKDNSVLEQSIIVYVVPQKYIYDVVLDYGSEATQMMMRQRGQGDSISVNDIVPLYTLFKKNYGKENGLKDVDCMQYDPDDEKYYKSIFHIRNDIAWDSIDKPTIDPKENVRYFSYMNEMEELKKTHFTLPNIKVAHFGGVELPNVYINGYPKTVFGVGEQYFYRTIVNLFVRQALNSAVVGRKEPCYFNMCMLMPNIYTQKNITRNLRFMADDILSMAENRTELAMVKGVEVSSASESDASFLGLLNIMLPEEKSKLQQGHYLIMDAGKGTLDFSIIDYDPTLEKTNYECNTVFRSGIIGAGNAITYSLLLALLYDITKALAPSQNDESIRQADISNFITKKMISDTADLAELNKIINLLEQYKRLYSTNKLTKGKNINLSNIKSFNELTLTSLENILREHFIYNKIAPSDHADSYVDNMIEELAKNAAQKIKSCYGDEKNRELRYVIFTGRGFKMEKFRKKVFNQLKSENPELCKNIKAKELAELVGNSSNATHKNICMFITNRLVSGRYNGRLVGIPSVLYYQGNSPQAANKEDVIDNANKTNSFQGIKQLLQEVGIKIKPNSKKFLLSIKNLPLYILAIIGIKVEDEDEIDDTSYNNYRETVKRHLVEGFPLKIQSVADQILICGVSYTLPTNIYPGNIKLFFNGADFELRTGRGLAEPLIQGQNLDGAHVFESTFPFGKLPNGAQVPFPTQAKDGSGKSRSVTNDSQQRSSANENSKLSEIRERQKL